MTENMSCANCAWCFDLKKFDYSKNGSEHTDMEGYVCMALESEGLAIWMVGVDREQGKCEAFAQRGDRHGYGSKE